MDERDWLAERFEEHRTRLRAVAYRMLGSLSEADDAVQEAWLRLSRSDAERGREPRRLADDGRRARVAEHAALAQVAARGAARRPHARADRRPRGRHRSRARGAAGRLGRSRAARRARDADPAPSGSRSCCTTCSPCRSTRSRRSSTAPPRRRASSPAAPAAASGARPRSPTPISRPSARSSTRSWPPRATATSRRCSRVLDPDVVLRADLGPLAGGAREVRGAEAVASQATALLAARPASCGRRSSTAPSGMVTMRDGEPFSVGGFTVRGGRIVAMDILADPERLRRLDLTILDD